MGLTRQSVQRTVDGLEAAGLVSIRSNPAHRRSHLLALSVAGSEVLRRIHAGEVPWAARLAAPLGAARIRSALELLTELREALDGTPPEPTPAARAARGRRSRP
jgi:DNA-binding MarR family transcriptional regulator